MLVEEKDDESQHQRLCPFQSADEGLAIRPTHFTILLAHFNGISTA
jgi:hypothetical protein